VAPTAHNSQPFRIIVVEKEEGLNKLQKAAMPFRPPLALIICGEKTEGWVRPFDGKLHIEVDASIVTDHMILQATALGLDSLWICKFDPAAVRSGFSLPERLVPINILYIGYGAGQPKPPDRHEKTRRPLAELVCYETAGE
jgi:nitroreductase